MDTGFKISKPQLIFVAFFVFVICPVWWLVVPILHQHHPLYQAVIRGDVEAVQERFEQHPDELEHRFFALNATSLHLAAGRGDTDMIELLLRKGASIQSKGYRNLCTPLHCAASKGHIDAMCALLQKGANVNARDRDNETPLHFAAGNGHADAVAFLVQHGAAINARSTHYCRTPLEEAVESEPASACRTLLEHRAYADFDVLNARVKQDMARAPLASKERKQSWLDVIAVLKEFEKRGSAQPAAAVDRGQAPATEP